MGGEPIKGTERRTTIQLKLELTVNGLIKSFGTNCGLNIANYRRFQMKPNCLD